MDRNYWEKIAPGYDDEIFDVLKNDRQGVIRDVISSLASPRATVLDAGCAVGKWLPVLSPLFKKVIAADISSQNLAIARDRHGALPNIDYLRADFSSPRAKLPLCDVAVCINAILTDAAKKRDVFFTNLGRTVRKGGALVLVVPSLESGMLSRIVQRKWRIDQSLFKQNLSAPAAKKKYEAMLDGNLDIDNVPTKHYLASELELLLQRFGFSVRRIEKIAYEWTTEFVKPPIWLQEPGPWDWLCVATRK